MAISMLVSLRATSEGKMQITSTAFASHGSIPAKHTCEGPDVSPALAWVGAPAGTKSFALIVDDPDAVLPDLGKPTKAKLEGAMKGHVLAEALLMGTYQKAK